MVSFQTKNPSLGTFWRTWEYKILFYILVICNILLQLGIFYGHWVILYSFGIFFPRFGIVTKKNMTTLPAIEEIVAMGREIGSRQGFKKQNCKQPKFFLDFRSKSENRRTVFQAADTTPDCLPFCLCQINFKKLISTTLILHPGSTIS
jgi:hypothetical protein